MTDWSQFRFDANHSGWNPDHGVKLTADIVKAGLAEWSYQAGGPVVAEPIVHGDRVYFGCKDGNLYIGRLDTAGQFSSVDAWQVGGSASPAVGTNGDVYAYGFSQYKFFKWWPSFGFFKVLRVCLHGFQANGKVKNGFPRYLGPALGPQPAPQGSPVLLNGDVYVALENGTVLAIHGNDGSNVWPSIKLPNTKITSSPAVGSGPSGGPTVYVGTRGTDNLGRLQATDGVHIWKTDPVATPMGDEVDSSPAVVDGERIYVGCNDGGVWAFNVSDMALGGDQFPHTWQYPIGNEVWSSPAVANGIVYVGANDNKLHAINPDGSEKWLYETGGSVTSCPTVAKGVVYIGSNDKCLWAFNADSGEMLWQSAPTVGEIHSSPAVVDRTIFIGSGGWGDPSGKLYTYHKPAP